MYDISIGLFFSFLDEDVLNLLITETNRYATQLLSTPFLFDTNNKEMRLFLTIIMWLVPLPTIVNYCGRKDIYI